MCNTTREDDDQENPSQTPTPNAPEEIDEPPSSSPHEEDPIEENDEEPKDDSNSDKVRTVGPQAINVAHSIVNACLSQLCEYKLSLTF